jgi:predicted nucleic acid-binding protein
LNSPNEVYVDTNGFSDLFRRDSPEERDVRGRLQASARGGTYRYLTSGWTIEELAGLAEHNSEKFHRVVQFVFELVGENLIDDTMTLLEREIRSGRPLKGDERMVPRDQLTSLRATWADSETARRISQGVREENRRNKAEFEAARQVLLQDLAEVAKRDSRANGDPRIAARLWFEDADTWITQWTRKQMAQVLRDLGEDPARAEDYPVAQIPALRNGVAMMIARLAFNVGYARRVDEGDNIDSRHYVSACYANILVSGDRVLAEIIGLLRESPVRPISMLEFAGRHFG